VQLPQGMAYGWWHFDVPSVRDLSFRIQIAGDTNRLPGRYLQLYQGKIAGVGFYLGFQTDTLRPDIGWQGHGLIFSRWGSRDSGDARIGQGGWIENAGHEGGFVGVRATFAWFPGEYRCDLRPSENDSFGVWYEFTVKHAEKTVSAGSLRFPTSKIESGGGSWTEVYSAARNETEVPLTELRIIQLAGNDGTVRPIRCDTTYNDRFASSDAFFDGGSLVLRSGGTTRRKHEPRQYALHP